MLRLASCSTALYGDESPVRNYDEKELAVLLKTIIWQMCPYLREVSIPLGRVMDEGLIQYGSTSKTYQNAGDGLLTGCVLEPELKAKVHEFTPVITLLHWEGENQVEIKVDDECYYWPKFWLVATPDAKIFFLTGYFTHEILCERPDQEFTICEHWLKKTFLKELSFEELAEMLVEFEAQYEIDPWDDPPVPYILFTLYLGMLNSKEIGELNGCVTTSITQMIKWAENLMAELKITYDIDFIES